MHDIIEIILHLFTLYYITLLLLWKGYMISRIYLSASSAKTKIQTFSIISRKCYVRIHWSFVPFSHNPSLLYPASVRMHFAYFCLCVYKVWQHTPCALVSLFFSIRIYQTPESGSDDEKIFISPVPFFSPLSHFVDLISPDCTDTLVTRYRKPYLEIPETD